MSTNQSQSPAPRSITNVGRPRRSPLASDHTTIGAGTDVASSARSTAVSTTRSVRSTLPVGSRRAIIGRQIAAILTDDTGQLQLVIQRLAPVRRRHRFILSDDARRIREVKHRHLIPLWNHVEPALPPARFHVLLEGVEVANAGDGWQR